MSPTVEGPLLSLAAHGALGQMITYKTRGSRARVERYARPTDPESQAQLNHRAHYLDGARLWKILTPADQLNWTQQHQRAEMSAYNIWMQTVYKRETEDHRWKNPHFFSDADTLENFLLVHPMELMNGSQYLDISGHERHWSPTNTTQEQGDRGDAALVTAAAANTVVEGNTNFGNQPDMTIALRFYTDTDQDNLPGTVRIMGAYNYSTRHGFLIAFYVDKIRIRIGDGSTAQDLDFVTPYVTSYWNNLFFTFEGSDSGRVRAYLNGALVLNDTTGSPYIYGTDSDFSIGGHTGATKWPGFLDNVTIYAGLSTASRI